MLSVSLVAGALLLASVPSSRTARRGRLPLPDCWSPPRRACAIRMRSCSPVSASVSCSWRGNAARGWSVRGRRLAAADRELAREPRAAGLLEPDQQGARVPSRSGAARRQRRFARVRRRLHDHGLGSHRRLLGRADSRRHQPRELPCAAPHSGAYVMVTAVKKAWLQSAPWILLALSSWPWPGCRRVTSHVRSAALRSVSPAALAGRVADAGNVLGFRDQPNRRALLQSALFLRAGAGGGRGIGMGRRRDRAATPVVDRWSPVWRGAGSGRLDATPSAGRSSLHGHVRPARPRGPAGGGMGARRRRRPERRAGLPSVPAPRVCSRSPSRRRWPGRRACTSETTACLAHPARSRRDYLRQLRPYLTDHSAVFAGGAVKDALGPIQIDMDVVIAAPASIEGRPLETCSKRSWPRVDVSSYFRM